MAVRYLHTQPGTVLRWSLGIPSLLLLAAAWHFGLRSPVAPVIPILLTALFLFHSLTVAVDGERVALRFGPGLLGRSFRLERIREAAAVRTRWYHGWGIHLTPRGWLYNVSGLDAVEITFDDGARCLIGTDEPEALVRAIREALRSRASAREGAG
jgi:hypothetical protein